MRKWWLIFLTVALVQTGAWALYAEHGAWQPGHDISASFWPKGAAELANRKERIGGHMLNAFDHFLFRGDKAALNRFLLDLGKVQGPRTVYLVAEDERVGIAAPAVEGADWTMSLSSNSHVGVFLAAKTVQGGSGLKIPVEVQVETVGKVDDAVSKFAAEHEKERQRSPKIEKD